MRKYLALFLTALAGLAVMQSASAEKFADSIDQVPESVKPEFHNMQKNVGSNIPVTFIHQPPLVPHSIRTLQVTKNVNHCLGCHAPEVSPTTGAPRVPESHFLDRDGKRTEGTSPRRYFCLQCHVQQAEVDPIIQNKFDSIRRSQGK